MKTVSTVPKNQSRYLKQQRQQQQRWQTLLLNGMRVGRTNGDTSTESACILSYWLTLLGFVKKDNCLQTEQLY